MTEAKCEYCGCQAVDCLARCIKTGLYFCNGKGDTSQSHIIHYLRSMNESQFALPDTNGFAAVDLKCYVCESRNIYNLGFIQTQDASQIFIVCRAPCQYDARMIEQNVNHASFRAIVSNGEILPDMVRVPQPAEYMKITMEKVHSVNTAIREKLGIADPRAPRGDSGGLDHAKLRYSSTEEFCDIMNAFVDAESKANEGLEERNRFTVNSVTWNGLTASFRAPSGLYREVSLGTRLRFQQGDVTEEAFVTKKSRGGVGLEVKFASNKLVDRQGEMTVTITFNDIPFARQKAALAKFREGRGMNPLFVDIILGNVNNDEEFQRRNRMAKRVDIRELPREHFEPMNQSQTTAMYTALGQRFTMIQGPPGTGKTTVIAGLVYSLVCAGIRPVLVCAQSNVAADFATKRVAQTGVNVCRVLASTREQVDSDIEQFTTKRLAMARFGDAFAAALKAKDQAGHKNVTKMEMQVVEDSDVVCTTCTSAGGARLGGHLKFGAVLFDESGQLVDPDLIIPMVHGAQHVILVGDHKQLGPVIISPQCQSARYDMPIMQRLVALGFRPQLLRMQYRMHPGLSAFPSKAFYEGLLRNGLQEKHREWLLAHIKWPNPNIPMFFWNVKSEEEYYENGLSFVNRHEAGCIAVLLDALWRSGVSAESIGIITPYAGQQAFLIDSLPSTCSIRDDNFFRDLEIASVDAFQGREKDFIILSNVRANNQCEIGFLNNQRRMCVALTRARYGLIVVACADTFTKNAPWCQFMEHCEKENVLVEGTLNDLRPSHFEPQLTKKDGTEAYYEEEPQSPVFF